MFERFTGPALDVRTELDRRRARYADGLDEDDTEALATIGIDLDEVLHRIERNLGGLHRRAGRSGFSRSSRKALELALREALALRHNYIGTERLLLGLSRVDDQIVADALGLWGIEHAALRRAVAEAVRQAG